MASSEFVITEEQYEKLLRNLINAGSKIAYDVFEKTKILYLTTDSVTEVTTKQSAFMALKHPSFASDEPAIVNYKNGDFEWFQFKELQGDGHIKINSRRFLSNLYQYFYVTIGYTSFFVTKDETYIPPPRGLISIYNTAVRSVKSQCSRTLIGNSVSVHVSKAIIGNDPNWLSAVRAQF